MGSNRFFYKAPAVRSLRPRGPGREPVSGRLTAFDVSVTGPRPIRSL